MKDGLNVGNADAAPLGGNKLYVGGSGPNNYSSIQAAIDDAVLGTPFLCTAAPIMKTWS